MHHFEAHELADSWELRAGLLDADPADASISACLRECAAALRAAIVPDVQPKGIPVAWSRQQLIHDDDGYSIGTDEPELHWGKEPPDDEPGWHPLYAAAGVTTRDAALEEAAQLCERWNTTPGRKLAGEIRALASQAPAPAPEPAAWVPYLSDRADGVAGHYAIARHHPSGYREVWNLRKHCWGSFSDDVLTLEQANTLLRQIVIPTASAARPIPSPAVGDAE